MKVVIIMLFLGIALSLACLQKPFFANTKSFNYEIIELDGIVKYRFYRTKNIRPTYVSEDFWVQGYSYTDQHWKNINFLPSYYDAKRISSLCKEDILTKFDIDQDQLVLGTDFTTTKEQTVLSNHLFYEDEDHLFIAFHFTGKGLLIHKICPDFLTYSNRDTFYCPLPAEPIDIPMIQLLSYSNKRALTKEEIQKYGFKHYPSSSFERNWCE